MQIVIKHSNAAVLLLLIKRRQFSNT